ncbi:MAG: thioredoxin [Bacilli bacterium]|nr:thioredoxin [Bacilli bacterium]
MPKQIATAEEFDAEIKSGKVLVDLFATWCGPCKMLSPVIDQVEAEHPEVKFIKVDVDEVPAIAARYNVYSIPTILVFNDGEKVNEQIGFVPKPGIEKLIA